MKKKSGISSFNYNSISSLLKLMIEKPHSNKYENDFSDDKYTSDKSTLKQIAEKKHIYIGTIASNNFKESNFCKVTPKHFNSVTVENELKWGHMSSKNIVGEYDFSTADEIINYCKEHNCRIRGHVLVWGRVPGKSYPIEVDELIQKSNNPKETLKEILKEHIYTVLNHFHGSIDTWDVVNEPFEVFGHKLAPYSFYEILGKEYIKYAFKCAREADPYIKLYLNEQFFYYRDKRAKAFIELLKEMVYEGIPIDGVGLQHHVMFNEQSIEDFKWFIEEIKNLGLEFEITELDIREKIFKKAKKPALAQAESYYKIVKTSVDSGICKGITFWGIDDSYTWYDYIPPFNMKLYKPNNPLLFDEKLNKKPAYYGVLNAMK